jgi:hypothetical protein
LKKQKPKIIKDKKLRGEWAEMKFMARAAEHGLSVSKPWGEMRPYDFVVGKTGRFVSVQVKSTVFECKTGYGCTVRGGHKAYPAGSFDFVAAYAVPEDVWYILPAALIRGKKSVTLFPHSKTAKYEQYREAWHLLREATASSEKIRAGDESRADSAETGVAVAGAEVKQAWRPPRNALERMQASFDYVRNFFEQGGAFPQKRDEEE